MLGLLTYVQHLAKEFKMPNNASALVAYGSYTSDGNARTIEIPPGVDHFVLRNRTDWGDTTAITNVQSEFQRGMDAGSANGFTQAVTTNILSSEAVTSGGFTLIDTSSDTLLGPELSLTAITNADPPVASIGDTSSLSDGDIVRIYNSATAQQIAGYDFTIDNIVSNTSFELIYMTAPGSVGGATTARRLAFDYNWYPRRRFITDVTIGTTTEVQLSVTHDYVVGAKVRFSVSADYGMTELDGLQGQVTAINTTTNTITVDIDSSSFTAFSFPSDTTADAGVTPAHIVPVGEVSTILTEASQSAFFKGIRIGASVCGPNTSVMDWWAFKADVNI